MTEKRRHLAAVIAGFGFDPDFDRAARRELDGVVRELQQHLAYAAWIGSDTGQICARAHAETQLLFPRPRLQQPRHRASGLRGIAILIRNMAVFAFVARQGNDVVEKRFEAAPGLQQHFDMALLRAVEFAAFEQLRHAEKRIQRRADFMADIGDERRFGARARFGQIAGRLRVAFLARQQRHEIRVFAAQAKTFVQQTRRCLRNRNTARRRKRARAGSTCWRRHCLPAAA